MSVTAQSQSLDHHDTAVQRRPAPYWRCLAIVALPIVMLFIGKLKLMERGAGMIHLPSGDYTLLQRVSFFREDLLVGLIAVPAVTLLLAKLLGRWRTVVLALLAITAVWLIAIEFQTHRVIGRFLSPYLIEDTLRFGWTQRDIAGVYVSKTAIAKPVIGSLVVLVAAWWASKQATPTVHRLWPVVATWIVTFSLVAVTALTWGPWGGSPALQRGVASHFISAFRMPPVSPFQPELAGLTQDELTARYRAFTRSPDRLPKPAHFGMASGCDVIFIVLETAPASVAHTLSHQDMPNLARLQRRAWVAQQHHSTYPFTSYAMWSIVTSWYPSNINKNYPHIADNRNYPGVMQSLKTAGYQTALYIPDAFTAEVDDVMYDLAGVDRQFFAYEKITPEMQRLPTFIGPAGRAQVGDPLALDQMLRDITQWHKTDQRFIAHFAPQLGHAPWPHLGSGKVPSSLERGREVLRRQDAYIGKIIDHLESLGRLDSTVILVTGDHGIRTWREDPKFAPGMLDSYTFHVPLTLYCPSLKDRQNIPWLTSHIDIAPSVLDLLGITTGRSSEQGSPLWDHRLADRITFFLARDYLGADGYHANGVFYMWKPIEGVTYRSDSLHFKYRHALSDPAETRKVHDVLLRMAAFQAEWVKLAPDRPSGQ